MSALKSLQKNRQILGSGKIGAVPMTKMEFAWGMTFVMVNVSETAMRFTVT